MLREWDKKFPGRLENMITALQNVEPSHQMDIRLHDFKGIHTTGVADPEGDKAFDKEELPTLPGALHFMARAPADT
jgi:tRNA 2-thiocytidine biosynthesis protein TtcA